MIPKFFKKSIRYLIIIVVGTLIFVAVILKCTANYNLEPTSSTDISKARYISFDSKTRSFQDIVDHLPSAQKIQSIPVAAHPRLLVSEPRFAEIEKQVKTDKTMKQWYQKLSQQAEKFTEDELPIYEKLDGKRLFKENKRLLRRVTTLALLYKIEKKPEYFDRVWQELKAAADFPDWNPDHFLDTARMTYISAIGYDWLYEDWSEEQRQIIRSAIIDKGLKPALDAYRKDKWWIDAEQNWSQVCNGGIGVGALAVMDEYPKVASQILGFALEGISAAMKQYAPDGGWDEGTSYWNFGTKFNVLLLAALDTAFNTDFNLSEIPGFEDTGLFPIYMNGSSGLTFNFSDGKERPVKAPQLFWLSNRFGKKVYADYQLKVASPEPLDLIWYQPNIRKINKNKLPLDKYFRGAEVVSMRSQWEDPEAIFVGFKAGDNNSNHGNLDIGTFVIDALGIRWAVELGYDDYNLPGYFDRQEDRWSYYRTRAEGQNTLIIDPDENPDQNPHAKAKITKFSSESNQSYATADLTPAYSSKVKHLSRTISLNKKNQQLTIRDRLEAETPVDLWWFMHTKADIELGQDGHSAILKQEDKRLWINFCNLQSDSNLKIIDASPLQTSPNPINQDQNDEIHKLTVRFSGVKKELLSALIIPIPKEEIIYSKVFRAKAVCRR